MPWHVCAVSYVCLRACAACVVCPTSFLMPLAVRPPDPPAGLLPGSAFAVAVTEGPGLAAAVCCFSCCCLSHLAFSSWYSFL
jgi:hypothetical protein